MDYELAKQLRDAGFPQTGKGEHFSISAELIKGIAGEYYIPTLEELIEACGDSFHYLERTEVGLWRAFAYGDKVGGFYKTSQEAVAKLYLALSANPQTEKSI